MTVRNGKSEKMLKLATTKTKYIYIVESMNLCSNSERTFRDYFYWIFLTQTLQLAAVEFLFYSQKKNNNNNNKVDELITMRRVK